MSALRARIGAIFIPVSDIASAKAWYARLLQTACPATLHGHLAVFALAGGIHLVLDAKIFVPGASRDAPLFHFDADDIDAALIHVQALGATIVTPLQSGHWFTFRDPDGNVLMACRCAAEEAPAA
ncbi:VOC family protein [Bradyrhizobium sp. U87765 SZCCT0131]|uniref:VOC family protein n=1 Tax=unclassified Bradyrhizobium TaxID=2631580 RepID=UPI001BA898DF|nr:MULTISPECIES: VOC family protein [unclassified Bradyrhizobium]MBR1219917.1 VOC family protein [Bradyrhizobium sp. U87765 SZCCT0131]MBR1263627.1 VOC family protein [Bradyrhizobium sp. U87765 SZCCT0134]MBR1309196.1 VOC family protein [Bradyrhizobium sp. U87765 SZCCT0110]MBR1323959.1 VOC family protein [Bradyrhizobium sp. U87765 SZCCT0109]MBR1349511.1 VOC family protein [Bradyrhizobium sp. U87765 SZCCT0048]